VSRDDRTAEAHRPFVDLVDRVAVTRAGDPAAYRRVRLRLEELRAWFLDGPGWQLVESHGVARLVKEPARATPGQGIPQLRSGLDYELLAWTLWYGEKSEAEQFVLTHLLEEIPIHAAEPGGDPRIDWDLRAHRESLERAIRALEGMGALATVHGDVSEWVRSGKGDTLYEFTGLAQHLHVHLPDPLYDALVLDGDPSVLSAPAAQAGPRERLYRALLLSPALHAPDDLEAFALLRRRDRRETLAADFREHFGWELEVTDSYAALLRPFADAVGLRVFPGRSAITHAALLMGTHLREKVADGTLNPDAHERITIAGAAFETLVLEVRARWGQNWGTGLGGMSREAFMQALTDELRGWEMLQGPDRDGYVTLMPLVARFAGCYREHGEGMDMEG
jgi:uncharacterized protein (TIGR02678 family)